MKKKMRTIEEVLAHKRAGLDCAEDESVQILSYFDVWHPEGPGRPVAAWFPLETDHWFRELECDERRNQPRADSHEELPPIRRIPC